MPAWLLPAIMGGASLAGALFGNKRGKSQSIPKSGPMWDFLTTGMMPASESRTSSGSSSRSRSVQNRNLLTMPEISAAYKPMEGLINSIVMQRLKSPSALPAGFEQSGIIDTNRTFAPIERAAQNRLASSGVLDSGAQAAVQAYLGGQKGQSISDFRRQIPMQERALRNEDLGIAQGLISQFGRGQRETGTVTEDTESSSGGSSTTYSPARFDPSVFGYRDQFLKKGGGGRNTFGSLMDMVGFLGGAGLFGGGGGGRGVQSMPTGPNYGNLLNFLG